MQVAPDTALEGGDIIRGCEVQQLVAQPGAFEVVTGHIEDIALEIENTVAQRKVYPGPVQARQQVQGLVLVAAHEVHARLQVAPVGTVIGVQSGRGYLLQYLAGGHPLVVGKQ